MAAKPHDIILASMLLLLLSTAAANSPDPTNPPYSPRVSSSTVTMFALLLAAVFFLGVFTLFLRLCCDSSADNPFLSDSDRRPSTGLDPTAINSLPVILYSEIKEHQIGKEALECAICLNEFEDKDSLRLIPKCDHVFHPECIDSWLELHDTCPVCRAILVPESGSSHHGAVTPTEIPDRETFSVRVEQLDTSPEDELGRRARLLSKFSRSHSTGHSIVRIMPNESERFRLRLSDHIREEVLARAHARTTPRRRDVSRSWKRLVKSDRWHMLPGEWSTVKGCRPAINLSPFRCLGPTRPSASDGGIGLINASPVRMEV